MNCFKKNQPWWIFKLSAACVVTWVFLTSSSAATNAATAFNTRIVVTFIASTRSQLNCAIGAEVIKREAPQGTVALPRNRAWWEELRPEALRAGPNIPVTTRSSNTIINSTVIIKMVAAAAAGRRLVRTAACRHQDPLHEGTSFSRM